MNMLLRTLPRILALLTLAVHAGAHSVLVVDHAAGPGSTHTTISAAIAAAQDGDFVLVRDGYYGEAVVLDGKGLRIHADSGATVRVKDIRVVNLGPGQTAVIGGLTVIGPGTGTGRVLLLANNQGPVWLRFDEVFSFLPMVMQIEDCESVVLQECSLVNNPFVSRCGQGSCHEAVLTIERSEVALFDCDLGGLQGSECDFEDDGSIGLLAIDSDVWVHGSRIAGGRGAGDCGGASTAGAGGVGLELRGASEVDRLDSEIHGGPGGIGIYSANGLPGADTNVVSGVLRAHGNVSRLVTTEPVLRSRASTSLTYQGKPSDVVFLLIASDPDPFSTLPNVLGPVVVPPTSLVTRLGRADAAGQLLLALDAPPVANGARTFFLQVSALNHAAGEIVMGEPFQLHVLSSGL